MPADPSTPGLFLTAQIGGDSPSPDVLVSAAALAASVSGGGAGGLVTSNDGTPFGYRSGSFTPGTVSTRGFIQLLNPAGSGILVVVREAWWGVTASGAGVSVGVRVTGTPIGLGGTIKSPPIAPIDSAEARVAVAQFRASNTPDASFSTDVAHWVRLDPTNDTVPAFDSVDGEGILLVAGDALEFQGNVGTGSNVWAWAKWFEVVP